MERGIFQFGYKNLSIRIFFSFKYYKIPFLSIFRISLIFHFPIFVNFMSMYFFFFNKNLAIECIKRN